MFTIIGKKKTDCYVIYDNREGMGGKCCCTKYTIQQLIEKGYEVVGSKIVDGKLSAKNITICNINGEPSTTNKDFSNVPDTKRSAVTIEKGLKLSRAERKAKKEAQKVAKEKAKRLASREKTLNGAFARRLRKKVQTSKPLFQLKEIRQIDGEYNGNVDYTYNVKISTPSGVTKYIKGLMLGDYQSLVMPAASARELNVLLRKYGSINMVVVAKNSLFSSTIRQVVSDSTVLFDYSQNYDDYQFVVRFNGKLKEPELRFNRHCSNKLEELYYGCTANSKRTVEGLRNYLLRLGYI